MRITYPQPVGLIALLSALFSVLPGEAVAAPVYKGPVFRSAGSFEPDVSELHSYARSRPRAGSIPSCSAGVSRKSWNLGGRTKALSPSVVVLEGGTTATVVSGEVREIVPKGVEQIAKLPTFLAHDYALRLSQVDADRQTQITELLDSTPSERQDEIAFLFSHLSPEDMASEFFDPSWFTDTAAHIYKAAANKSLSYVSLVEKTDASGGQYTTLRYRLHKNGTTVEAEIPPAIYYWYVVHPKLDLEPVQLIDPTLGDYAPPPLGLSWREYYLFTPQDAPSYTKHFLFQSPKAISDSELQGWGPSAATVFADLKIGPLELVRTPQGLALLEFHIGPGTVLATTMPLEKAWKEGTSTFLENCLRYGNGNVADVPAKKHLVVMNRSPYQSDTFQQLLDTLKVNYEIKTSDDLAQGLVLDDYFKIIVPSDQPRVVYQALADRRSDLETWIASGNGKVLELHAATATEEDWSGLVMPGGFTIKPLSATNASDVVQVGGYPDLSSLLADTSFLWDGEVYAGKTGDRLYDSSTFVLDKLGLFTSRNLPDNVAERIAKVGSSKIERATQAVRVLYNHYGNCGEIQDVLSAASRSALVPVVNVGSPLEDHVWNQFYSPLDNDFLPYQVSWSGADTHIAYPGISYEKKFGAEKDISVVSADRPDGMMINQTFRYSDTWTLRLKVTDKKGRAVDGAQVLLASETYYPNPDNTYDLGMGFVGYTNAEGEFVTELGDAQNFYLRIESPLGSYPAEANMVKQIATVSNTVPGFELKLTKALPEAATVPADLSLPEPLPTPEPKASWMEVKVQSRGLYLVAQNPFNLDTFNEPSGEGTVDLFVLDEAAYKDWTEGKPVTALWGAQNIGTEETVLCGPSPAKGNAYLVFSAPDHLSLGPAFSATVTLRDPFPATGDSGPDQATEPAAEPRPEAGPPDAQQTDVVSYSSADPAEILAVGGGCSCRLSPSSRPSDALWAAFSAALLLIRRRRKTASQPSPSPQS